MLGPYLLPNRHNPEQGYDALRAIALREVYVGEYGIGFYVLGRAVLKTPFVRKDTYAKKVSIRSFAKIVEANFELRRRKMNDAVIEEKRQAIIRVRTCRIHLKKLYNVICQECNDDERTLGSLALAVDEMGKLVKSVCRDPNPPFSPSLFAELEGLFTIN